MFVDTSCSPDAPKLPSVSVSPSGEIVEGSSVTLTCSSDANPAANYTWYKENEASPKASGQIFTITDVRSEHSGNYYCEVQNIRGRQSITIHLTVAGAWKLIAVGTIAAVLLVLLILVALCIRASKQPSKPAETLGNSAQCLQTQSAEQQDALLCTTVDLSKEQADTLCSNISPAQPRRHKEEEEALSV
ncbi:B-cell receptor CD22-like [Thunnus maccoyii]|uniref:B-cell receptor CD22-like n=1 Tax=Thunnus maccoyii TaxID=8240 RepID=UPI001C4AAA66|nr:B-cell receptor CD22-like [Thunnus maccoyii]